jgi:uncharacterized protein (TIGR00725 family)
MPNFRPQKNRNSASPQSLIGVIGASDATEEQKNLAWEVGKLIGNSGLAMICGGLGGAMEAASRGCAESGGVILGLLPGERKEDANPFVTYALPTNLGYARNMLIAHAADILVAVGTGYGTLSEIAIALKLGKKVLSYQSWDIRGVTTCRSLQEIDSHLKRFFPTAPADRK